MQHHENTPVHAEASLNQRAQVSLPDFGADKNDVDSHEQRQQQQHPQNLSLTKERDQFTVRHYEHPTCYGEELFEQRVQSPLSDSDLDAEVNGGADQDGHVTQEGVWATYMCEQVASRPTATGRELIDDFLDQFCSGEEHFHAVCSWGMGFLTDLGYDLHNV